MISKEDYTFVANKITQEVLNDIRGNNPEWLFGKKPSENVMIGMIASSAETEKVFDKQKKETDDFRNIPSVGMRFKISKDASSFGIHLCGKLFYRIKPTFEQQVKFLLKKYSEKYYSLIQKPFETKEELLKFYKDNAAKADFAQEVDTLVYSYEAIDLKDIGELELIIENTATSVKKINEQIESKLNELIDVVKDKCVSFRNTSTNLDELLDEDSFNRTLEATVKTSLPTWKVELIAKTAEYDDYYDVILQLVNKSPYSNASQGHEVEIYDGGIEVISDLILPIEIKSDKHYYLDKPELCGLGNNCSVEYKNGVLRTVNIPIYYEKRVKTVDEYQEFISFDALIEKPVENLTYILKKMKDACEAYKKELERDKKDDTKTKKYLNNFSEEVENFEYEVSAFEYGIKLIENLSDVRKAFSLMNKTFKMNKSYPGWRLFQIVFIVSSIADSICSEYKDSDVYIDGKTFNGNKINNVDLIYFPTGGGKTETFLGASLFAAFFDRIRGKKDGTTCLIKYPLRLLAAQQMDRVLQLIINANIIKNEHKIEGEDFSAGFYTGQGNTPNSIDLSKANEIISLDQTIKNNMYRQIDFCPICGSEVNVEFDKKEWRLKHTCSNDNCGFVPNIYIVDEEIYRFTPTYVVSTIDKMANVGLSPKFKCLLGQAKNRCSLHGYTLDKKCNVPGCNCDLEFDVERKDPIPTFFIQDELHLVNQSLGTFDSHYESFIKYYCEKIAPQTQRKTIKYIGATATITNYKEQIKNLYGLNSRQFPTTVKKTNFYSYIDEDDICRVIVGLSLFGGSIPNNIRKTATTFRRIVTKWVNELESKTEEFKKEGFMGDSNDLYNILQDYIISIVYNNSKHDAGGVQASMQLDSNNASESKGENGFNIAEISGDVDFKTIKKIMHEIEASDDKFKTSNCIISTSAISHGVDVDSFNQIFFYGIPIQTAEYIQAYSRVGRKHTGIVFDVFRLVRDRDKSFLKNFDAYHNYKELLIDPVAINRYAKNAIYSTLPGIVSALLMQKYSLTVWASDVSKAMNNGILTKEQLLEDVHNIYESDLKDKESKLYSEIIDEEVDRIFNMFTTPNNGLKVGEVIKKSNAKNKGPMINLRDVDINLLVSL